MKSNNIVDYLRGRAPRIIDGLVQMDDAEDFSFDGFESRHDLIQWMFPTMRPSSCQPHSPVLSWEQVQEIHDCKDAQLGLLEHLAYYRKFLENRKDLWLVNRNHNHLRITRVIECLSLLRPDHADAEIFHHYVNEQNAKKGWVVNVTTVEYWNEALWYGSHVISMNNYRGF